MWASTATGTSGGAQKNCFSLFAIEDHGFGGTNSTSHGCANVRAYHVGGTSTTFGNDIIQLILLSSLTNDITLGCHQGDILRLNNYLLRLVVGFNFVNTWNSCCSWKLRTNLIKLKDLRILYQNSSFWISAKFSPLQFHVKSFDHFPFLQLNRKRNIRLSKRFKNFGAKKFRQTAW